VGAVFFSVVAFGHHHAAITGWLVCRWGSGYFAGAQQKGGEQQSAARAGEGGPTVLLRVGDFLSPRLAGWDHLLMDQDDPEKRIAELERQLAEQKRIAELERQLAEAKRAAGQVGDPQPVPPPSGPPPPPWPPESGSRKQWSGTWVSVNGGDFQQVGTSGAGSPLPPEAMQKLAAALQQGNLPMDQLAGFDGQLAGEIMRRAGLVDQAGFGARPTFAASAPSGFRPTRWDRALRLDSTADRVGAILGVGGGVLGGSVGGAAALTAVIPSSALWTSGIVCNSPYHLAYTTSNYSYKPGQSGTSVGFQCVSGDSSYPVNGFGIMALQAVPVLIVLCAVVALVLRYLLRKTR